MTEYRAATVWEKRKRPGSESAVPAVGNDQTRRRTRGQRKEWTAVIKPKPFPSISCLVSHRAPFPCGILVLSCGFNW